MKVHRARFDRSPRHCQMAPFLRLRRLGALERKTGRPAPVTLDASGRASEKQEAEQKLSPSGADRRVDAIENDALGECSSLTTLFVPDGVTAIGAFGKCLRLRQLTIVDVHRHGEVRNLDCFRRLPAARRARGDSRSATRPPSHSPVRRPSGQRLSQGQTLRSE
jgi:hypothetical protein